MVASKIITIINQENKDKTKDDKIVSVVTSSSNLAHGNPKVFSLWVVYIN